MDLIIEMSSSYNEGISEITQMVREGATPEEISKKFNIRKNTSTVYRNVIRRGFDTFGKYKEFLVIRKGYDCRCDGYGRVSKQRDFENQMENLGFMVPGTLSKEDIEEELSQKEISQKLFASIEKLEKYRNGKKLMNIIKERFFNDKTLEEISSEYGLTRERVRQIETEAINKLKFLLVKKEGIALY